MDLNQLKAEHPALYQAAVNLGVEQGVEQERERVSAHLELGSASGDMEYALSCISDGKELTLAVQSKYTAAGMRKQALDARETDNLEDIDEDDADPAATADKEVAEAAAQLLGVEING